jgi:hypothetical protein
MDDIERPVHSVTDLASTIINTAPRKPAFPTTHPRRKYMITPRIVSTSGVKTPPNVPKLVFFGLSFLEDAVFLRKIFNFIFSISKLRMFFVRDFLKVKHINFFNIIQTFLKFFNEKAVYQIFPKQIKHINPEEKYHV